MTGIILQPPDTPGATRLSSGASVTIPQGATVPPAWGYKVTAPTARATDPNTSHTAAKRANINAGSNAWLCLKAHVNAGHRGLNGDELAAATGRKYEAIGPRRPGLERAGLICKATTERGAPMTRDDKQVYVATRAGIETMRGAA